MDQPTNNSKAVILKMFAAYFFEISDALWKLEDVLSSDLKECRRRRTINFERSKQLQRRQQLLLLMASMDSPVPRIWSLDRTQSFWERDCQVNGEQFFKSNFRMDRVNFQRLCEMLPNLQKMDTILRKAIPLPKRVAIAVYALGSSAEYRTIANLFGVGKSTVCEILIEFCQEVWRKLSPRYLGNLPLTKDKMQELVEGYAGLGFPQCIGAIDGCHIEVHPPEAAAVDYYNYKGWYSTVLLALVDYRYRFLYINVGSPGRCNDSQIYETSKLKKHMTECPLFEEMAREIAGVKVSVHIMGDSAFRFSRQMMKPYPFSVEGDEDQKNFNYALSKSRRVVENAFGHLKARFRRIGKGIDNSAKHINSIIKACCVLHNFLNECNDHLNAQWLHVQDEVEKNRPQPEHQAVINDDDCSAEEIRQAIARFVSGLDNANVNCDDLEAGNSSSDMDST